MTKNEIFETVAKIVANKNAYRGIATFHGEHEGEELLIDFAYDDGRDFEDGIVCAWTLWNENSCEELDNGTFSTYHAALGFLETLFNGKEVYFYAECF